MAWTNMSTKTNGVVVDQNDWNQLVNNFAFIGGTDGHTHVGTWAVTGGIASTGAAAGIDFGSRNSANPFGIYTQSNVLYVNANGTLRWGIGSDGTLLPQQDNAMALGGSSNRFTAVYAVNGTIQTSTRAAKEGETPVAAAAALAAIKATPVVRFKYQRPPPPPGVPAPSGPDPVGTEQIGFIAEDADPMLTLEDGVSVNAQHTASVTILALQALLSRVEALEAAA
jgi:hypothetical protein